MSVDTERLRRLAEQAPPGPWLVEGQGGIQMDGTRDFYTLFSEEVRSIASVRLISDRQMRKSTAGYIAAANPTTVLELLDELERLRAEVERLRGDRLRQEMVIGALEESISGANAEVERLRGENERLVRSAIPGIRARRENKERDRHDPGPSFRMGTATGDGGETGVDA